MRRSLFAAFSALITITFVSSGLAQPTHPDREFDATPNISGLIQQADKLHLSENRYWRALLHYRQTHNNQGVKSSVISPEFFLSPEGSKNPSAELSATLAAFFQAPGEDLNQHPQCRFVARYQWLRKSLDWGELTPPDVKCEKYQAWSVNGRVNSISVIFATGYLSNPASLYGHLLLKFNTPDAIAANELLDPSMSYGALVPPQESGVVYIYKGLLGGYDAGFSHEKFYRHNHSYAEVDLRDLWEYQLALSKAETDAVVAHGWELLRVKFNYLFFSENCATAIAELLSLVIEQPLLADTPWAIPSTVFNKLVLIDRDGVPLVAKVGRIPSRQNRFYDKYFALSPAEQHVLRLLVNTPQQFNAEQYLQLSEPQQVRTIETLIDYYQFRSADEHQPEKYRSVKQALLIERLRLPSGNSIWPTDNPPAPHEGQPPMLLQASTFENSNLGGGIELRIRPAYYDFLALDAGRAPNSSLSMFDLRTVFENNRMRFKSLDLVEIETLNLSRTNLPGDGGNAWKIKFGFEQQDLSCDSCTVFNIESGAGRAARITSSAVAYGMLEGRAQSSALESGTLAATARIGLAWDILPGWRTRFAVGERAYMNGNRAVDPIIHWENRFGNHHDWDWRLTYEKHVASEIKASASFYW